MNFRTAHFALSSARQPTALRHNLLAAEKLRLRLAGPGHPSSAVPVFFTVVAHLPADQHLLPSEADYFARTESQRLFSIIAAGDGIFAQIWSIGSVRQLPWER